VGTVSSKERRRYSVSKITLGEGVKNIERHLGNAKNIILGKKKVPHGKGGLKELSKARKVGEWKKERANN